MYKTSISLIINKILGPFREKYQILSVKFTIYSLFKMVSFFLKNWDVTKK